MCLTRAIRTLKYTLHITLHIHVQRSSMNVDFRDMETKDGCGTNHIGMGGSGSLEQLVD